MARLQVTGAAATLAAGMSMVIGAAALGISVLSPVGVVVAAAGGAWLAIAGQ